MSGSGGSQSSNAGWTPKSNPWVIALVVTMAAFMEILDTTIVNVSLPYIAGSMAASNDQATWTLTSYLVANAFVLAISGFLARKFGRKKYFIASIAGFTICSFLCGIATSLPELIVFRAMQGLCGGGLQTNQQAIILDTFPPAKRGAALSITAVATIIAPALGPTLGGWLTVNYSWHWVFLVNVPFGIATIFGVLSVVEDPPWQKAQRSLRFDYIGIALIALGLGCLQVMLDRGEDDDWFSSSFIVTFAVLAYCCLIGAVCWLLSARRPVVKLSVLGDRNFAVGVLLIFCMFSTLYASAVIVPQLAQQQLGYTAEWAGFVLSPGAVVIAFIIPVVGLLSTKVETRFMVAFGFAVLGSGLTYSYYLSPQISFWALAEIRIAQSVGIALLFVPINAAAFLTIPKEDNGDASALFVMFRNVAGSIGISLSTAMVTERTQVRMAHLSSNLTPFDQGYLNLLNRYTESLVQLGVAQAELSSTASGLVYQQLRSQAAILGNADVFLGCAILAFLAVPLAFLLSGGKGKGEAA